MGNHHDGLKHAEIIVRGYGLGMVVREFPVRYVHDDDSRCVPKSPLKAAVVTFGALLAVFRLWLDCSVDFHNGILERKATRGAALLRPFV